MTRLGLYICAQRPCSAVAAELPEKYTVQPFSKVMKYPAATPPYGTAAVGGLSSEPCTLSTGRTVMPCRPRNRSPRWKKLFGPCPPPIPPPPPPALPPPRPPPPTPPSLPPS